MALGEASPKDVVRINGGVVYTINHKPLKAGHVITGANIDNKTRQDARFRRERFPRSHMCK